MCMYTYIQTRIHTHVLAYMYMHRKRAVYGRWNKPKNLNWWMKILLVARLSSYSFLFYTLHLAIKLFIQINIDDRTGLLYTYIYISVCILGHLVAYPATFCMGWTWIFLSLSYISLPIQFHAKIIYPYWFFCENMRKLNVKTILFGGKFSSLILSCVDRQQSRQQKIHES